MSKQQYPEELKIEAVKQITERGHSVADVSKRIGVSGHSLYASNAMALIASLTPRALTSKKSCAG